MQPEPFTILDPDGAPQMSGTISAGRLQDTLRIYNDGAPQAALQFADGVQEGECIILHAPHRPSARMHYLAGRLHGPAEFYSPQGALLRKTHYRRGLVHGVQQDFYADGTLFESGTYRDGVLDGDWQRYYPSGVLSERRTYAAGLLHRTAELFGEDGQPAPPKRA